MNREDVVEEMKRSIAVYGSQKAFANWVGVSPQYISDVLKGRRLPSGELLECLNLKRVVTYENIL